MRLTDFFPSRKHGVRCPTCARRARIPLNVVLIGVVVMFGEIGLLMWLLAATNVLHPETPGGLVVSFIALLGGIVGVVWSLSLLGRNLTHHLE
jgi:hypothetical protein